jgi:DNA polymerase-3 subunit beta
MKIICTQENLKSGLFLVGRVIPSATSLPILNNILLKTNNGMLKISSTNLEIAINTQIRCKIEEEGESAVASKTIIELINTLPNKNLTLETINNTIKIEAENYHTLIKTLPADDFPLIPEIENDNPLFIDAQELKSALDRVVFAASNNQTQPEIAGTLFRIEEKKLKVVATDRYRLAEKTLHLNNQNQNPQEFIIPQKTATELSRIIGNQEGKVAIVTNLTQISFNFLDTQVISRLVDGQYPPYEQIIPNNFSTTIVTKREPLINALKAGAIFCQNSNSITLEYISEKKELILTSESGELGKNTVELESKIEGTSGSIIMNYRYILDCLNCIRAENVVIKIVNDSSPSLITSEENENYLYLVMPIKI